MSDEKFYYDLSIQMFEEDDGSVTYSVIQNFSEKEDDHEVIAYGVADSPEDAIVRVRKAADTVLTVE